MKVLLGCLVDFILDYIWFSNQLFGVYLNQKDGYNKNKDSHLNKKFLIQILLNSLMILVTGYLFKLLDLKTFSDCIFYVVLLTFGFTGKSAMSHMLWEMKSFKYFILRFAYPLVSLSLFSFIYVYIN